MPKHPKEVYAEKMSFSDKLANRIAQFVGNMVFVWIHAVLFVAWFIINGTAWGKSWDPYPYNFLTLIVSLEAIFLSTFVLISQNRESKRNEVREQLDYEVNVKAEQEIQELKLMVTDMRSHLIKK
ncbi:MAG: DUF1003 domain-containing protein [Patescibacteria group bacterium]